MSRNNSPRFAQIGNADAIIPKHSSSACQTANFNPLVVMTEGPYHARSTAATG